MIDAVAECAARMRRAAVEVSLSAMVDANAALSEVDLASRSQVRSALASTLVKRIEDLGAFTGAFDRCFPVRPVAPSLPVAPGVWSGPAGAEADLVAAALTRRDVAALEALSERLVQRYGGLDHPRPSPRYHLQRVERAVDLSGAYQQALREDRRAAGRRSELVEKMLQAELSGLLEALRRELRREVLGRLTTDDAVGSESDVGPGLVTPPPLEEIDFLRASRAELQAMRGAVRPLARRLAARLARDRRHRSGRVDFRRTVRQSLATGGVTLDVAVRHRARSRPDLWLLCDVSGSMAEFARFALGLVYALHEEFPRTRTFVFVDDVEELTATLRQRSHELDPYALLVQASDVHGQRRSDYGRALQCFWDRYGTELGPWATVIVAGDARTHDRDPGLDFLQLVAGRARRLWWLNPEPRALWDHGDSVASLYAGTCTEVAEVRNLRQLSACILELA